MNSIYLKLVVAAIIIFGMNQACNTTRNSVKDQPGLTQTAWQLIEIEGADFENLAKVWLKFENNDEKKVSGYAGCNRFFGAYEVSDYNLKFGKLASTKMYCPQMELESFFLKKLENIDQFEIIGSKLRLFAETEEIMIFQSKISDD